MEATDMDAKVFEVTSVSFALTKSLPPGLIIHSTGKVSSSGWSNARLVPYVYLAPPQDGIWDFDLIATPPEKIALTVICPISASEFIEPMPSWCRGVRVHAGSNEMSSGESGLGAEMIRVLSPSSSGQSVVGLKNAGAEGGADTFPWAVNT
jgi:hypothetical protein